MGSPTDCKNDDSGGLAQDLGGLQLKSLVTAGLPVFDELQFSCHESNKGREMKHLPWSKICNATKCLKKSVTLKSHGI